MNHLCDARTQYHRGNGDGDITEAELKKAITPIKSFLTRREVAPEEKARIIG
jgi:hypothetical protein